MLSGVLAAVVGCIAVAVYGMVFGLFLQGIDRKCAAHMQARVGPPIRQPFIDIGKLLCKDNVIRFKRPVYRKALTLLQPMAESCLGPLK